MVDFKKKLGLKSIEKKVNPFDIYNGLDRRSETGPLRPVQQEILTEWWHHRKEDKDLVLKLHTGQGKTLIGLLILQSKLNENKGPCLYICPNIYLVEQTCEEADKFGIGYVTINDTRGLGLPEEFLNSEKILITHVQKVFNGKSVFGIGGKSKKVNTVILDDSHACIDFINESFTIRLKKDHKLYQKLLELFENDLKEQGEGSFFEIKNSGEGSTILPVPYWSWEHNKSNLTEIIGVHKNDEKILFIWDLIKDNIENCQCFFTGKEVQISMGYSPVNQFGTFSKAEHRILMSATTQNDSFFLKSLGLNIKAIQKPLALKDEKWSGEKMILIPSLIDENLSREVVINEFIKEIPNQPIGRVALVPSFKKAKSYFGSVVANKENIFEAIGKLKTGDFSATVVIVNRYDGIDLPDDSCRILIIDSMPYSNSLTAQYEEECRSNSDLTNIKYAQKIEQGLGRSVRGEKDYSVILIIGDDLVKFIKSVNSNNFFSNQTRKQIDIGIEVSRMVKEEKEESGNTTSDSLRLIRKVMNQCLIRERRDEGWKEFYREKMEEKESQEFKSTKNILEILELERRAEENFCQNEIQKAIDFIQKIIDSYCSDDWIEKGWYLQILARYKYKLSKIDSNHAQQSAFKHNSLLLKPREGTKYNKLSYINENRIKRIKEWCRLQGSYEELIMNLNTMLESLSFGQPSEKFEKALQDIGCAIGFLSQRPDREFKKGPDNLWCISNDEYFMFECKSEVEESRNEITKTETGQMNNHCAWFEQTYKTDKVKRVLIIPTKNVSNQGSFTHEVEIMKKGKLRLFKNHVKSFFKEFKDYLISELSDSKVQEFIDSHELDIESLKKTYSEKYYQRQ